VNAAAAPEHTGPVDDADPGPVWLRPIDSLAARDGPIGSLAAWVSESAVLGCAVRFFRISGRDRVLVLGGQTFTALIPLAIVVAAVASSDDAIAQHLITRFHLTGTAAESVETLFSRPPGATGAITVLGFFLLLYSVVSLTRYLQRTYEAAWELPPAGIRGTLNGLSGMLLLLSQLVVLSLLGGLLGHLPAGGFVSFVVHVVVASVLWLQLQYLLLARRVPRHDLVPGAVVAGIGQAVVSLYSAIFMPHILEVDSRRYGIIGVTFGLLTWLIVISACFVAAAVISAEFGHRRGFNVLDRSR
jgi:membrane protein